MEELSIVRLDLAKHVFSEWAMVKAAKSGRDCRAELNGSTPVHLAWAQLFQTLVPLSLM